MQRRQLVVGVICAVVAVLAVFAYTAQVSSAAQIQRAAAVERYGGEQVEVVVTQRAVGAGEVIGKEDVALQTWVVDLLPQAEVAVACEQVWGLVAEVDLKEGEPLLMDRVGEGSSRISVPEGLEAVTVSSDDVLAVGGAIQPGSFVNVYVEATTGKVVLLGQRVLVLETSAAREEDDTRAISWVTLAVTPESVGDLITASARGAIHLVLPGTQTEEGEQ